MAVAAKSNAVYTAWNSVRTFIKAHGSEPVPDHLRNAPTQLAKSLGHGARYRYSHDEPDAYSPGQTYFPERIAASPPRFYEPTGRGLESRIAEKLAHLRGLAKK
jgi:putative ATPase